jgi:hypothetical protein
LVRVEVILRSAWPITAMMPTTSSLASGISEVCPVQSVTGIRFSRLDVSAPVLPLDATEQLACRLYAPLTRTAADRN